MPGQTDGQPGDRFHQRAADPRPFFIHGSVRTKGNGLSEINALQRRRDVHGNKTKGVSVRFMDNTSVDIELSIIMKYGCSIPKVCKIVQEKVKMSVESMAGLNVTNVSIKIIGVDTDNAR